MKSNAHCALEPSRGRSQFVMLLALVWIISGALYLALPPGPDQFNHAYMGWRLLEGDAPYRDFIDPNWPGVMGIHALAIWLFGVNLWSWHAMDFLMLALTSLALADIVRLAVGRDAARWCLLLMPLIYVGTPFTITGQHDMTAAQLLTGAAWCHLRAETSRQFSWRPGAGVLLALAMLNKPTVGVLLLIWIAQALLLGIAARTVLLHVVAVMLAMLATLIAAALSVMHLGTSPSQLFDATYRFNLTGQFVDATPRFHLALLLVDPSHSRWWILGNLLSLPGAWWMCIRANRCMASTTLHALWVTGVLSFLVQSRGFHYHLAPALIAIAGFIPASLALILDGRVRLRAPRRSIRIAFASALAAVVAARIVSNYAPLAEPVTSARRSLNYSAFKAGDGISLADVMNFKPRLEERPTSECVLVMGSVSAINYLSKRPQPTRFYYAPMLADAVASPALAASWQEAFKDDLRTANCHFVLLAVAPDKLGGLPEASASAGALRAFLESYRRTGSLHNGRVDVFEKAP